MPCAGDALVKVNIAGICNTDLELIKGYMGFHGVPGHEFVGVVESSADEFWIGKRVCGEINYACDNCDYCRRGLERHCPNRTVMGILNQSGAFAEYLSVPLANLRLVPGNVPDKAAVFTEPLAAAFEILEQVHIQPEDSVAVVGDGKLGLLVCQVLKLSGCNLTLIGKHESKLALAASWGIAVLPRGKAEASSYNLVVEASGSPSGFDSAMELLRPRGTLILKSTYAGNLELNMAPIVIDEIQIIGSRCGRFQPALRALSNGLVNVTDLIDCVYPFDQALAAFEHASQPGTLKVLIDFNA